MGTILKKLSILALAASLAFTASSAHAALAWWLLDSIFPVTFGL
jgi:hypothetical protein